MAICPNCGKNTPEGKFCEHCGAVLQSVQVQAPSYESPQPVIQQQQGNTRGWVIAICCVILIIILIIAGATAL